MAFNYNPLLSSNFETKALAFTPLLNGGILYANGGNSIQTTPCLYYNNVSKYMGIGTSNPDFALHLQGPTGGSSRNAGVRFNLGTTSDMTICAAGTSFGNAGLAMLDRNLALRFKFSEAGHLGIGLLSPTRALEIRSTGNAAFTVGSTSAGGRIYLFASNTGAFAGWSGLGSFSMNDLTANAVRWSVSSQGNLRIGSGETNNLTRLDVDGAIQLKNTEYVYFGAPNTNGTVRIGVSGTDFVTEIRVAGSWVTKGTVSLL